MADPYHLVAQDAMDPPDLPDVGVNVPSFRMPEDDWVPNPPPGGSDAQGAAPPAAVPKPAPVAEPKPAPPPEPKPDPKPAPPPEPKPAPKPAPPPEPKPAPKPVPPPEPKPAPKPAPPPEPKPAPKPAPPPEPKPAPKPDPPKEEPKKEVAQSPKVEEKKEQPPPAAAPPPAQLPPSPPPASPASPSFAGSPQMQAMPQMPVSFPYVPQYPSSNNGSPMVPFDTVASSLRSEIERAERRLEDSNRTAIDDRKGFQAQIDTLHDELKKERDVRMKLQTIEISKGFETKLQDIEKARERLENQYKEQLRVNDGLQEKLREREDRMNEKIEELKHKQQERDSKDMMRTFKRDVEEEGRYVSGEAQERTTQMRKEFEMNLARERESYMYREVLLSQRVELQNKTAVIDLMRREQTEREWEEGQEWDDYVMLKKEETKARGLVASTAERRRGFAGGLVVASPPFSVAAKAKQSLRSKRDVGHNVYTTKSFKKVYEVLEAIDLTNYAPVFAANEFDVSCLAELTEEDLDHLGINTLGARKRLMAEADKLRATMHSEPVAHHVSPARELADEVSSEWAKERMRSLHAASDPNMYNELLVWDEAWKDATALDAAKAPSSTPGGHKAELLLQRLSGAPPPAPVGALPGIGGTPGTMTSRTSHGHPPPPPPGPPPPQFITYHTQEGVPYYYDPESGATTWSPPQ